MKFVNFSSSSSSASILADRSSCTPPCDWSSSTPPTPCDPVKYSLGPLCQLIPPCLTRLLSCSYGRLTYRLGLLAGSETFLGYYTLGFDSSPEHCSLLVDDDVIIGPDTKVM